MLIARTYDELRQATREIRRRHQHLALVPTMGALHAGHLSLIAHAQSLDGGVVASIFVNPLQFGASEDLSRYPRDEPGDLHALSQSGCDAVWLPATNEMYPAGDATRVEVGGPALGWEGAARPGHFSGVATVVAKLFGQVGPDAACFGEKDWQQLAVIRRLERDLALGVRVIGVPTLRENDGLAFSSRNRFLTPAERTLAPLLYAALQAIRADLGSDDQAGALLQRARAALELKGFQVDYLALVNNLTMEAAARVSGDTRVIAAAKLGSVRLLDNIPAV